VLAEDPSLDFMPVTGEDGYLREPGGFGVRVDSALYTGMPITVNYDSLIAKVIAWGEDRQSAIRRLQRALGEFQIGGVPTDIEFLSQILESESFPGRPGRYHLPGRLPAGSRWMAKIQSVRKLLSLLPCLPITASKTGVNISANRTTNGPCGAWQPGANRCAAETDQRVQCEKKRGTMNGVYCRMKKR
jgi:hypothetical protein